MKTIAALVLALGPLSFGGNARAAECAWLAVAQVDEALPAYAPWSLLYGSDQGCNFMGRSDAQFGATPVVKESAGEANRFARELRESVAQYRPAAAPQLGRDAFSYRPPPEATDPEKTIFFVAPSKKVVMMVNFTTPQPLTTAEIDAAATLARASLEVGRDRETVAAALECRWLDAAATRALLGRGYDQQSFEGGCIASGKAGHVSVTVGEAAHLDAHNADTAKRCTTDPVPSLGAGAMLAWDCREANPHALVRRIVDGKLVEYAFVPPQAPTAEQRKLLVELAAKAR